MAQRERRREGGREGEKERQRDRYRKQTVTDMGSIDFASFKETKLVVQC